MRRPHPWRTEPDGARIEPPAFTTSQVRARCKQRRRVHARPDLPSAKPPAFTLGQVRTGKAAACRRERPRMRANAFGLIAIWRNCVSRPTAKSMFDKSREHVQNTALRLTRTHGDVAQLGEHHVRNVGAEGSNPFISTMEIEEPRDSGALFVSGSRAGIRTARSDAA